MYIFCFNISSYPKAYQYFLPVFVLVAKKHWNKGVYFTFQTTQLY